MRESAATLLVIAAAACGGEPRPASAPRPDPTSATPEPTSPEPTSEPAPPQRVDLRLDDADGLSGLTTDGDGVHWAVAETVRALVRLRPDRYDVLVPIDGVPEEIDLEAVTWVGENRFAVGTESTVVPRSGDRILWIEVDGARATVADSVEVPYAELPIEGEENRGIEGLCRVDGHLIAAYEQPALDGDRRLAVLADRAADGSVRVLRFPLTTDTGKISGLDCRRRDGTVEVVAIERHYAVHRVLRVVVPDEGNDELEPQVVLDLAGTLAGDPNLEGITWDGDDILLIVDNLYGERSGPNELIRATIGAR